MKVLQNDYDTQQPSLTIKMLTEAFTTHKKVLRKSRTFEEFLLAINAFSNTRQVHHLIDPVTIVKHRRAITIDLQKI